MGIKSRLFKQTWEHKDPQVRADAVSKSDDPGLTAELGRLAEHDESAIVRLAALKRINTEAFWLDARLRESDPAILEAADAFLKRVIMRKPSPDMLKERLEWFARIDDPELVRNAARNAPDEGLRAAALQRISAQGFLGDCYATENSEALADGLIERIDQESTLERIISELRKTSKKRTRNAERRLAAVRAAAGKSDPAGESARNLVDQMESLSRGEFEGDRNQQLAALINDWEKLPDVSDALKRRFNGAASIVRRALEIPAGTDREIRKSHAELAQTIEQASDSTLAPLARRLQQVGSERSPKAETVATLLSDWDRAWNLLDQPSPADLALREELHPIVIRLQKRHETSTRKQVETVPATSTSELDARLNGVAELLETGDIAGAHDTLRKVRSLHDQLPPRERPRRIGGRLNRMDGRLKEMRNWQHWSNNKVRDEIIGRIEQLAESDQHPDAITTALKEAREEWQRLEKLEILPGDKRRFAAPPGQWRRFQAACKVAFETAKPFFEKRHEVQEENKTALSAFVDQGNALAEREDADSQQLVGYMRKARQAIRRLDDIPPRERGAAASKLRKLMDRLSVRIDAIYEEIELTKRRLVTEARALAHEPDLKSAIEKAKELQARWQRAGSGRRRTEQQLWKEFREPIDPLFEKLRGERDEQQQQHKEEISELRALCEQAEALAALNDAELDEAEGRFRGLSESWHAQPRRPRALDSRFEKAEEKFNSKRVALHQQRRAALRSEIESVANSIQQVWEKRVEGQTEGLDSLIMEVDDEDGLIADLAATARRYADADCNQEDLEKQVIENACEARRIVIEMEFLAGLESPDKDRELRMSYQVQRLAKRMSDRDRQPDLATELRELRARWYQSFPQPLDQKPEFAKRFEKCQNVIESMIGE